MKILSLIGISLVLIIGLAGCGGGGGEEHHDITGPGLVGIDDSSDATAPLLTVTYTVPPSTELITAEILSDIESDGDIEFDPVFNTFTVTAAPTEVFFGEDSSHGHLPEFRAFLTFPLDGFTGQPVIPGNAEIVSATLEVLVQEVHFASVVPTFLDLIQYPFRGLSEADFDAPLLTPDSFRTLDFYSTDTGNMVRIDVTPLMQIAQSPPALLDFQVRLSLQALLASSRTQSLKAERSVHPPQRDLAGITSTRRSSSAKPLARGELAARHR